MKVLFISQGEQPDYLCDCVYHGLKSLIGRDMESTADMWYMYDTLSGEDRLFLYGKGFTLYGLLNSDLKNVPGHAEIVTNIVNHYYDYVIYGTIIKDDTLLDLVLQYYKPSEIAFIDGEDIAFFKSDLISKGIYFKRELKDQTVGVFPIGFGIPAEKIVNSIPIKKRDWAINYPGKLDTYVHQTEQSYYTDYQESRFAVTFKKEGWDCLRHYEILANGCLPYFKDIDHCPAATLVNFPKGILEEICAKIEDAKVISDDNYKNYVEELLNFARENLTTESVAKSILVQLGKDAKEVPFQQKDQISGEPFWSFKINQLLNLTTSNNGGNPMLVYSGVSSVQNIRYLKDKYAVVYATDVFESAVNSLKKVLKDDGDKVIFADDIFSIGTVADTIVLDLTLSYQENVVDYLIKIKSLMNAKSRLVLILPNFKSLAIVIAFIKNDFRFGRLKLSKSAPANFYSRVTVERLLRSFGLKITGTSQYDFDNTHFVKRLLNKISFLSSWSGKMLIIEASLNGE